LEADFAVTDVRHSVAAALRVEGMSIALVAAQADMIGATRSGARAVASGVDGCFAAGRSSAKVS